ncbi:MAG TPA: MFS transporter, partial [Myxococcota bacterium]
TAPYLCGAIAQLLTRVFVDVAGSRKRFVIVGTSVQALVHAGMIAIALTGTHDLLPLLLVNIAYWTCGMAVVPVWNAWMATITTGIDRGRYFALRTALAQVGLFSSYAIGGFAMEHGRAQGSVLVAFACIAGAGGIARAISASLLTRQADPGEPPTGLPEPASTVNDGSRRLLDGRVIARLREASTASTWGPALFLVAFQLAANVAIPFFTPYMLHTLRFNFVQFMELNATAIVTKAIVVPLWGRLGRRFGWRRILVVATLGTSLVALGWSTCDSFRALVFVQILSGLSWSCLELASFQLILLASPERHRVGFFALATSLTAIAQVMGSLVGSSILTVTHETYPAAFLASSILRALSVLWLILPVSLLARRDSE